MYSQERINEMLAQLNAAWDACADAGQGHDLAEMAKTVDALDAAQDWFKDRNIKLTYNQETQDHSLATEQPTWRAPKLARSFERYRSQR